MSQRDLQKITSLIKRQMLSQERGIFKPSLKSHSLLTNPTFKRYSFAQHSLQQESAPDHIEVNSQNISYPSLDLNQQKHQGLWSRLPQNKRYDAFSKYDGDFQNPSSFAATRFDPILPKLLFKRFVTDVQLPQNQTKTLNNPLIQQLKVKNVHYPFQVDQMFKEVEQKTTLYQKSLQKPIPKSMQDENPISPNKKSLDSSKNALQSYAPKGIKKIPFSPLMGTDGSIFWSFSIDKIILWRYKMQNFSNPEVFCILNFDKEPAPISAVYATEIQSSIFKHQKTILISIAFFDQLQFFSFNIQKYERQYIFHSGSSQKTTEQLKKYVEKIMVKVNAKFVIEKILVQNIPNYQSPNKHLRPLVIFTDGGKDLEVVDLENLAAYKSHSQFDIFSMNERNKANKIQNQIIKLLHCRDDVNPLIHYAFVLKKQVSDEIVRPKTFLEKVRNIFSKRYEKKQRMVLSIFEWNEAELKNDTLWKKVWNPQRVRKIKQITSNDLEVRLKQNFFDFYRLNINNEFIIADISLAEKSSNLKLFQSPGTEGCYLKVTFTNGTSVLISNFRTLIFASKVKVIPSIQKAIPVTACQYNNYRKLLDKGKYLQNQSQVKNKFNLYFYEPNESEKQPKFSRIDPVISQSNGLTICEGKIIYEDQMQILYDFRQSTIRKRIHKLNERKNSNKKCFMIFESSFITVVETPNIAQNFLIIGYLHRKYPEFKEKINEYVNSLFAELTEQQKINLIENVIEILMQIQNSGKGKEKTSESKFFFNQLLKEFYGKQNKFIDETTYLEERELDPQSLQNVYGYSIDVCKVDYENFVEYLLGSDVLAKQKQNLKKINSSYNGKTFSFKVTQTLFQFIIEILVEHGMKQVSEKQVKTTKNVMEISSSLSKYISQSVTNSNDQKYLANLFTGMFEIKESFLMSGLSKYIMGLIEPILNFSYKDFNKIKPLINIIGQKLDEVNTFLQGFIRHCSFKDNKSKIFEETVLFCKSMNNSLPKISLLLRLFQSLSEIQYCKIKMQNDHKVYWSEVTLKNLLFKVGTKDVLSRITAEDLFEENSMMLDQIEEKLPELNDIKHLRFYLGWKKINQKIIDNGDVKAQTSEKQPNNWLTNFFSNEVPKRASKKSILFENEQQKLEDYIAKRKQEFVSIEKALNEYSYENFEKFFIAKCQYSDFVSILLSKIYYLQLNYLELKEKYNVQDEIEQNFQEFSKELQKAQSQSLSNQSNSFQTKLNAQNLTFKSFLRYEEKVCGYQKYIKSYAQIRFFNQKMVVFFDKILSYFKVEGQKLSKNLISSMPQKQSQWSQAKGYQNGSQSSKYEKIRDEIGKMVDLILNQGSELMKREVTQKLGSDSLLESFIKKGHKMRQDIGIMKANKEKNGFYGGSQREYLVKQKYSERGVEDGKDLREEEERRKMYNQKINEQISRQLKRVYVNEEEANWMKQHNFISEEAFKHQGF